MKAEAKTSLIQLHTELCPDPKFLPVVAAKGVANLENLTCLKSNLKEKCEVELVFPQAYGDWWSRVAVTSPPYGPRKTVEKLVTGERGQRKGGQRTFSSSFLAKALYC